MGWILLGSFVYFAGLFFVYGETPSGVLKNWVYHNTVEMLLDITIRNVVFWFCLGIMLANVSLWFLLATLIIVCSFIQDVNVLGPAPKLEWEHELMDSTEE